MVHNLFSYSRPTRYQQKKLWWKNLEHVRYNPMLGERSRLFIGAAAKSTAISTNSTTPAKKPTTLLDPLLVTISAANFLNYFWRLPSFRGSKRASLALSREQPGARMTTFAPTLSSWRHAYAALSDVASSVRSTALIVAWAEITVYLLKENIACDDVNFEVTDKSVDCTVESSRR